MLILFTVPDYILCGILGWGYLFKVFSVYSREWVAYCFDLSAVKDNAIISIENALISHGKVQPTIRADNGSQYTSNVFRKSMSVLGLKLEHIAVNMPEQARVISQDIEKRVHLA
jgi:hypothetical protein